VIAMIERIRRTQRQRCATLRVGGRPTAMGGFGYGGRKTPALVRAAFTAAPGNSYAAPLGRIEQHCVNICL
jgi:hypothetical protein